MFRFFELSQVVYKKLNRNAEKQLLLFFWLFALFFLLLKPLNKYGAPDVLKKRHSASQRSTFAKKYSMNKVDLKFISKLQSCHDMLNTQMGRIDGMIINNSCFQGKYG